MPYNKGLIRMIMKVFNKGQVVIPAPIRRAMGIDIGALLDVRFDAKHGRIELTKPASDVASTLAGSLSQSVRSIEFPSRKAMADALRKGLARGR